MRILCDGMPTEVAGFVCSLEICSERAMLCLANLLSSIGSELPGGIDTVQNVWSKLSKLLTNQKGSDRFII